MSDITIVWNGTSGDWQLVGPVLATGNDLQTAVLISLFTDRVAGIDDVPPDGSGDPRGWWADDTSAPIGSRLWLLARGKHTAQILANAQSYCQEALQWLVDDGVAASFDVFCEWVVRGRLGVQVTIFKTSGSSSTVDFNWVWNS